MAAPADLLRLPQAIHWRLALPLPQLDVHRSERLLPDPGLRSGASACPPLRVAARLRAVFHVLHDQRRIQLRSAHVPHERARNGAARHADHVARVQRRVFPSPLARSCSLILMTVLPLLQFCSKAFGDYAAQSEVIDILACRVAQRGDP